MDLLMWFGVAPQLFQCTLTFLAFSDHLVLPPIFFLWWDLVDCRRCWDWWPQDVRIFFFNGIRTQIFGPNGICTFLCKFWYFTGFGLKFSINSGICAFLCEFWSSTGFGLKFSVDLGICTFFSSTGSEFTPLTDSQVFTCLSSTELGLRTEVYIFDVWG